MKDTSNLANVFLPMAKAALGRSGFAPPADREVRVLLLDARSFFTHATSASELLSSAEAARAARFRFDHDRLTYIVAHAIWRVLLAACLNVELGDLPLITAPSGQPQLPNTGMCTSLSHSGTWVAIALCRGESVGIDIESAPSRICLSDLVPTICTPLEASQLVPLGNTSRESALLALWTRKEALLKAFGVGLAQAMTTISAGVGELVAAPQAVAGCTNYQASMLTLPEGVVGGLAVPAGTALAGLHWLESA